MVKYVNDVILLNSYVRHILLQGFTFTQLNVTAPIKPSAL